MSHQKEQALGQINDEMTVKEIFDMLKGSGAASLKISERKYSEETGAGDMVRLIIAATGPHAENLLKLIRKYEVDIDAAAKAKPVSKPEERASLPLPLRRTLIRTSQDIRHSDKEGLCFYHPEQKEVVWLAAPEDFQSDDYTKYDDIIAKFGLIDGVAAVRIVTSWDDVANTKEYIQVYP